MDRSQINSNIDKFQKEIQVILNQIQQKSDNWRVWFKFLYQRFINLSEGMLQLYDSHNWLCVIIIWRSSFESLIDILLILKDEGYITSLKFKEISETIKVQKDLNIKEKVTINDEILSGLKQEHPDFAKKLKFLEKLEIVGTTALDITNMYIKYRVASRYVHGVPYDHNNIEITAEECINVLPVMFGDIIKVLSSDE